MENKNNIVLIIGIVGVLVVASLLLFSSGGRSMIGPEQTRQSEKFQHALIEEGVARVGQPIEGFDASILQQAFGTLENSDFSGVDTLGGEYVFNDGTLVYKRGTEGIGSSAEQSISSVGYAELLGNVAKRLGIVITDESIATILGVLLDSSPEIPPHGSAQEKIIYGTSAPSEGTGEYERDCTSRGGTFNTCGSPCRGGVDVCIQVCAYTCEFRTVTSFSECVAAGNAVMESYPRQCGADGNLFVEEIVMPGSIACTEEMRKGQICTKILKPVCALVHVQCVTTPCDPIPETFSNACTACHNNLVSAYTEGTCAAPSMI